MFSSRLPPNPVVRVSFPSDADPAPPQPDTMLQDSQLRQVLLFPSTMGHFRSRITRPLSTIRIFFPCRTSSMAAKIPAGPDPTIMASYIMSSPRPAGRGCSLPVCHVRISRR